MTKQAWTEAELRAALDRFEGELRAAGKTRNTVTTYVQHPERFINWLVGRYQTGAPASPAVPSSPPAVRTSKYGPLRQHLAGRNERVVRLTFSDIERIIGRPLPASARQYRPWWANEEGGTHAHARAWLEVGRRTANVDMQAGTVEFIR